MNRFGFISTYQKAIYAYNKMCIPLLKEFDIAQVSFDILMFLWNNKQYSTAQEISEIRHIKKNLVSVHVEKLCRSGLLERKAYPGDKRKIALSCTQKALPIIEKGLTLQEEFIKKITCGIKRESMEAYNEIMLAVENNAELLAREGEEIIC